MELVRAGLGQHLNLPGARTKLRINWCGDDTDFLDEIRARANQGIYSPVDTLVHDVNAVTRHVQRINACAAEVASDNTRLRKYQTQGVTIGQRKILNLSSGDDSTDRRRVCQKGRVGG